MGCVITCGSIDYGARGQKRSRGEADRSKMQARRHAHAKSLDAYLFTFLMRVDAMADIVVAEAKTVSPNHFQCHWSFYPLRVVRSISPPQVFLLVVAGWRGKHLPRQEARESRFYEVELCCRFIEKF